MIVGQSDGLPFFQRFASIAAIWLALIDLPVTTTSSISWLSATAADDISSESEIEIADLEKTELLVPPVVRINPPFFVEIPV